MAKRFTDTDKWKKPFIRGLQGPYKVLWLYILDDCDHAGIWQVDLDVAALRIGEILDLKTAEKSFENHIQIFDNGEKWFIPSFIEFQYGSELNPENRVHESILKILNKYKLAPYKPLTSPLQGAKDKDKDKDMDMDKDKDKDKPREKKETELPLVYPFDSPEFKLKWNVLIGEKKWRKKSNSALQAALQTLSEYSEQEAIQMIQNSIAGEYQGIFPLNNKSQNAKSIKQLELDKFRAENKDRLRDLLG